MSDSDAERAASKAARKAEKRKRRAEEEEAAAAAAAPAASAGDDSDAEDERAAKKARKAAKKAARHAEMMHAGAMAIQEEQQEEDDAAAAAAAPAAAAAAAAATDDDEAAKAERKRRKRERREAEATAAAAVAAAVEAEKAAAAAEDNSEEARRERKRAKKEKKAKEAAAEAAAASGSAAASSSGAAAAAASPSDAAAAAAPAPKVYPPPPPGNVTLLLFYQYVRPSWTAPQRQNAENFTRDSLTRHGCTGRLRCAKEGFNGTLTGPPEGIRAFCQDLREYEPEHFGQTDFKITDGLREGQMLRGLKVWHVNELVTYGFDLKTGSIERGGTHLPPKEWHDKAGEEGAVLIDVRNANENAIGRFQPHNDASRVLDPNMRTSTEFPDWVQENLPKLHAAKQVMMYCTGGIRCERASALLVEKGVPAEKVFQLEGGIHRYLEAFPDGGHWIGKNYVFDRRFAHGATSREPEVVGRCCLCSGPWDRYQTNSKCQLCRMEVLLCRECERGNKHKAKGVVMKCHLCGGPKPSYLPADDKTLVFKKKKHFGKDVKGESDY